MPLVLESANVVVRGNFNPYIFAPDWLMEQGVWPPQEVHLALGMLSDGIRFKSQKGDTSWEVDSKTLAVESLTDAGVLVAKVLRLLKHTPVNACGCNLSFYAEQLDAPCPKLGHLSLKDLPSELSPEIVKWTGVFHVNDVRIDMSVANGDQGVTVTFNFHQSVDSAEKAAQVAELFDEWKGKASAMIKTLLGESAI